MADDLLPNRHDRRQFQAFGVDVTPEELAQINWNDKSNISPLVWGVNITAIVLIILIVSVRLAVRRFVVRKFFIDDYLVLLAALCTILVCAVGIAATKFGLGQHVWNLDLATVLDNVEKCIQLMFVGEISYAFAICFTKLSIMASYVRIFPHRSLRIVMIITAAITVALFIAFIPATVLQCSPVAAAWDFTIKPAHCWSFVDFLYGSTAVNIATDLTLCVVPLPYFWKLQLPLKQRILVSGLFVAGGFACVATIIRLAYLHQLNGGIDVTYNLVSSFLWTMTECAIGIICVSLPPIRPLLARLAPRVFNSSTARRGTRGGTGTSARRKAYVGLSSRTKVNSTGGADEPSPVQIELAQKRAGAVTEAREWTSLESEREDHVWDGSETNVVVVSVGAGAEGPRGGMGNDRTAETEPRGIV